MNRLFTFGCSFTQYGWPTWADILGKQFDFYQNWGLSGAGNLCISSQVGECDVKNQLGDNDTVIVMWSSVAREDRYVNNTWISAGNVFTNTDLFGKDWVKKFADIRGYYVRDLALINLVDGFLQSKKVTYYFLSMQDFDMPRDDTTVKTDLGDIFHHYGSMLRKIRPSVHKIIFNHDYSTRPSMIRPRVAPPNMEEPPEFRVLKKGQVRQDNHPTPAEHLEYLETVLPELPVDLETKNWVRYIDEKLKDADWDISEVWRNGEHVMMQRL